MGKDHTEPLGPNEAIKEQLGSGCWRILQGVEVEWEVKKGMAWEGLWPSQLVYPHPLFPQGTRWAEPWKGTGLRPWSWKHLGRMVRTSIQEAASPLPVLSSGRQEGVL